MKTVECMEKFFLRTLLPRQKVYIIYQENIHITILGLEFLGSVIFYRSNKFICEFFRAYVSYFKIFILVIIKKVMSYGMHEVSFAKSYSSPYEKRIICFPWCFCDCKTRCMGEPI